ncbi:MAG: hypothetical protein IKW01_04790 [Firmicutes bacterium]|nr:hypothetical protein [Bacillota bacterium]
MSQNSLITQLIAAIKGDIGTDLKMEAIAEKAYEMGLDYSRTKRFDNSRHYHNYRFILDDGSSVLSTNFFNLFMTRNQTGAYMDAEKAVRQFFDDEKGVLFSLVRNQRFGINGVFKACMSPHEPQQLNYSDFVLVIACFCAGVMNPQ